MIAKILQLNQSKMNDKQIEKKSSGISITGLVMGICSVVLFWFPGVHFILVVLGIVFSSIALGRKEKFGVAGLSLSIGSYAIVILYFMFIMSLGVSTT